MVSDVAKQVPRKRGTAELLFETAYGMGLHPSWVAPQGLFVIAVDGQERYINFARSPLNSHTGASLARNKYLTRLILARHGMDNIPFTKPCTLAEAVLFLQKHGKIVAKPVNGAGARDIHIITNAAQLQSLRITGYILEKYIAGKELRYLVLNGRVIGVHESEYGTSVEETRALRRISYHEAAWEPALVLSSIKTTRILDLKFAAVDYLIDDTGHAYILEVNSTPGLKWFHAPTSGPVVDVARLFFESILNDSDNEEVLTASTLGKQPLSVYS